MKQRKRTVRSDVTDATFPERNRDHNHHPNPKEDHQLQVNALKKSEVTAGPEKVIVVSDPRHHPDHDRDRKGVKSIEIEGAMIATGKGYLPLRNELTLEALDQKKSQKRIVHGDHATGWQ